MQGAVRLNEACLDFADRLYGMQEVGAATQVIYQGHAMRALQNYKHFDKNMDEDVDDSWLSVNLRGCKEDNVIVILLAWSFNLSQLLASDGFALSGQAVKLDFGKLFIQNGNL